jgi:hypothetical protein
VYENRELRRILGPKEEEEKCVMRSFIIWASHDEMRRMKWMGH